MTCEIEEDGVIDDGTIHFNTTYVKPPTIANKVFKVTTQPLVGVFLFY